MLAAKGTFHTSSLDQPPPQKKQTSIGGLATRNATIAVASPEPLSSIEQPPPQKKQPSSAGLATICDHCRSKSRISRPSSNLHPRRSKHPLLKSQFLHISRLRHFMVLHNQPRTCPSNNLHPRISKRPSKDLSTHGRRFGAESGDGTIFLITFFRKNLN